MNKIQTLKSGILPAFSYPGGSGAVIYPDWSGVVRISDGNNTGSGVLSSSGLHVITAAHVVQDFQISNTSVYFSTGKEHLEAFTVQEFTIHPQALITDSGVWHDLALITLEQSAPLEAQRYNLYEQSDEIGQTGVITGYGRGHTDMNDTLPTLRAGLNTIDTTAAPFHSRGWRGSLDDQLLFDYDDGTLENDTIGNFLGEPHLGLGDLETMITPGDSGGGLFLPAEDEWLLAGIHSFASGDPPVGTPGDIGASTRISSYVPWIFSETGQLQQIQAMNTKPPPRDEVPLEVDEGLGVYFLVEIDGGASSLSSVEFFTRDGTAQAGLDYIPTSGQVVFEPGDRWAKIWVQTLSDNLIDGNEDFELVLTNPEGGRFPEDAEELSASRIIIDDLSLSGVTLLTEELFG